MSDLVIVLLFNLSAVIIILYGAWWGEKACQGEWDYLDKKYEGMK